MAAVPQSLHGKEKVVSKAFGGLFLVAKGVGDRRVVVVVKPVKALPLERNTVCTANEASPKLVGGHIQPLRYCNF